MSEEVKKENQVPIKKNQRGVVGAKNLKWFGRDKPAIPGPGRPRLSESVKVRRQILREKIEAIAPEAIAVVHEILKDAKAEDRDKLRAAEIALSHTVPKLEEVETHDERPLPEFRESDLTTRLTVIRAEYKRSGGVGHPPGTEVAA